VSLTDCADNSTVSDVMRLGIDIQQAVVLDLSMSFKRLELALVLLIVISCMLLLNRVRSLL